MADEPKIVTDADGHRYGVKVLNPGEMLDLLEAAGDNSTNAGWVRMALLVASVTSVDDVPLPQAANRRDIRAAANKIGNAGLIALQASMFGGAEDAPTDQAAEAAGSKATAGN